MRSYIPSLLWRVCSVCCIWFENCACNCYNGKYSSVCKSSSRRKTSVPDCCASKTHKIIENLSSSSVFFYWRIFAKFRPTHRIFHGKNINTNSPDFQEFFFPIARFFMINSSSVSFTGDFSPNFDVKKYDFHRIFHGKK